MPEKQATLEFPIRRTRVSRNKKNVSPGPKVTRQDRSSSRNKRNTTSHIDVYRTPTKRKILQDNDQENCCSPPKLSPAKEETEDNDTFKKPLVGARKSKSKQPTKCEIPARPDTPRVPLSPLKILNKSERPEEIVTRSRSPFKYPLQSSLNNITSPRRGLNFQSPSRSPLRRLDLSSPAKSPLRSASPLKSAVKCLDLDSLGKSQVKQLNFEGFQSPRRFNLEDDSSPRRSPRKLNLKEDNIVKASPRKFNIDDSSHKSPRNLSKSPRRSPRKLNLNDNTIPRMSPRKFNLDVSPRRSPRKFNLEDNVRRSPRKFNLEDSVRRSPRKHPMSPLKFSSPSSLVSKLSLSSPSANRKAVSVGLFKPNVTAYRAVKQSLNTGTPTTLVCRDKQIEVMKTFLTDHLKAVQPGSLYVSGAPGTGKTACLMMLLKEMENKHKKVFVNCMTMKTSASIYSKIITELGLQSRGTEKENKKLIEKTMSSSKQPILIVLDEIDQLDSKNQEVLYTIFEWPSLKNSKLVLVGIANALDLTDRILPRLQARPNCKPQLLHYPPYSRAEIVKIINQRIQEAGLDNLQVIKPTAVQFLAGKVAAVAGDIRKALDVCRRAVELCEIQARRQTVLKASESPRKSPRKSPKKNESTIKMVEIPQVMAIFNEVYGSRVISAVQDAPESFTLQQKLLICCVLLFLKHAKSKDITIGKLHEVYSRICKKRSIPTVDQSEFLSMCTLLESRGMVQVKKAKEVRSSKIVLRLNPEEAEQALGDRTLLAHVLEDKESLGKLCKA